MTYHQVRLFKRISTINDSTHKDCIIDGPSAVKPVRGFSYPPPWRNSMAGHLEVATIDDSTFDNCTTIPYTLSRAKAQIDVAVLQRCSGLGAVASTRAIKRFYARDDLVRYRFWKGHYP